MIYLYLLNLLVYRLHLNLLSLSIYHHIIHLIFSFYIIYKIIITLLIQLIYFIIQDLLFHLTFFYLHQNLNPILLMNSMVSIYLILLHQITNPSFIISYLLIILFHHHPPNYFHFPSIPLSFHQILNPLLHFLNYLPILLILLLHHHLHHLLNLNQFCPIFHHHNPAYIFQILQNHLFNYSSSQI